MKLVNLPALTQHRSPYGSIWNNRPMHALRIVTIEANKGRTDTMNKYTADPRLEELQLLSQLIVAEVVTKHSATYDVAKRLEGKGEAMGWWDTKAQYHIEITSTGKRAYDETRKS